MTTDPQIDQVGARLSAFIDSVVNPQVDAEGVHGRVLVARQVVAVGGTVATLVQVVVWLLLAVFSGHLDSPWWLATAVPAMAATAVLTVADRWIDDQRHEG